ncbi:MAG TPA: serine hydrolase [Bryobacteraceae bacterium]|nr:serine hydrolase [Bryobacteraceae bacterium]
MIRSLTVLLAVGAIAHGANAALEARLKAAIGDFPGTVYLYAKNLDSGATIGIREDEKVRTASTIKLPIMAGIFASVAAGKGSFTDEIVLHDSDKVSGSGVLHEFSDGDKFRVTDVLHMMIVVSDNTATNLLLDHFSIDFINEYVDQLGLKNTRALRKVLGNGPPSGFSAAGRVPANERFGLGVSTPRDMVMLLEKLERGEMVSPEASKQMIEVLKRQQDSDCIRRRLSDLTVANKTGALDRLRSDVGIVYSKRGRIAMAITCDNLKETNYTPDNAGALMIADLAKILVEGIQ